MKLPRIHFDWMARWEDYKLYDAASTLLAPASTERLLGGHTTWQYENVFRELGSIAHGINFTMVLWERCGQNIYVVGPKVAQAMCDTDLTGIMPSMIKPEHRCFYIALADCPWVQWGGNETQWHQVTGLYVSYSTHHDPRTGEPRLALNFNVWGGPNERSSNQLDDVLYRFSVPVSDCPEDTDLETHYGGSVVNTVDDIFGVDAEAVFVGTEQNYIPIGEFSSDSQEDKNKQRQMARNVFRLAVNLILYLNSQGPEIDLLDREPERKKIREAIGRAKNPGKKKKLQRRLDNVPKTVLRYIGPKMEQKLVDAERESGERGPGGQRRRHLVRPHWNHYWVGTGESKKRVGRWIALHERGSAEIGRTVTVLRETVAEETEQL